MIAAILVLVVSLTGCVGLGYHQKKLAEQRKADFEFASDLAKKVRDRKISARDMRVLLRERYNVQEETQP